MMIEPLEWSERAGIALGILLLLLIWETVAPFFTFPRDRARHASRNISLGVVNGVLTSLMFAALWLLASTWASEHNFGLLNRLPISGWPRLVAAFLLFDCWMWFWHRINHEVPFLWRFHRVHHSDPNMDVTTANRFHIGEIVMSSALRVPVIALLGIQLWELALYETAMFAVVQLHHANVALPGPLDRLLRVVIVTPFVHKVHHSRLQPETDSNYGSLFSFWDRIFHTFRLRSEPREISFGLDEFDAPECQKMSGLLSTPWRKRE